MTNTFSVTAQGEAVINDRTYTIPGYTLKKVVASGANGVVFTASSPIRPNVAVKIWKKLKVQDSRDKVAQAVSEAQKACEVDPDHRNFAIRVYNGDIVDDAFFMAMEYFEGITLREWLQETTPSLALRWALARQLVNVVHRTAELGILHGDMHWSNILVKPRTVTWTPPPYLAPSYYDVPACPDFRVIDYGTSAFSSKEKSVERHWRLVSETFEALLAPFGKGGFKLFFNADNPLEAWKVYALHALNRMRAIISLLRNPAAANAPKQKYEFSISIDAEDLEDWKAEIITLFGSGNYQAVLGTEAEWLFVDEPFRDFSHVGWLDD